MKIGIDISQISYTGTGVSRFTEGLTRTILKYDLKNTWIFFYSSLRNSLDSKLNKKILSTNHKLVKYKIPPSLLGFLWNTLHIVPIELFTGNLDLFISSDWTEPPSKCKKTTIVHDLAFNRYPETIHPTILTNQRKRLKWVIKESEFIIADSLSTKSDLIHYYKYSKEKIKVIYPGVNDMLLTNSHPNDTLGKYHLKKSFIFTVGKIEPRKNLKRLLIAYNKIQKNCLVPDLVIAGQKGWEDESNLSSIYNTQVHFIGHISDSELEHLYQSCLFFIYPSLWEGFGYPIIEAMKNMAPVATSNSSSLSEIAQNAALLFNPLDTNSISQSIKQLINSKSLRQDLQKKGTIRAKEFTWERYYHNLIGVINNSIITI